MTVARQEQGKAHTTIQKLRNFGRGFDAVTILGTAIIVPLQPFHVAAVSAAIMGELIFENAKMGLKFVREDLPRSVRGSSQRERSALPLAA